MKIRGVLLGTIEEQRAGGDDDPVDPTSVPLTEQGIPVDLNFDRTKMIGRTTRLWLEDGRLMFEAEIMRPDLLPHTKDEQYAHDTAAIGFVGEHVKGKTTKVRDLYSIGLVDGNSNKNQPPWENLGE
jgi:hypothetical protein